ncbi:cucumber peeling cupredoxin [Nicotiana tabacum]|uniref:Cucumber peeling cupredoxin n=1 Tax=Nicotiana tabacum TaxID=4097 RepID=A0A1S3X165_TOBAC|nr:PREDICTED: cucumber peeling cupredoxin-like [Nicotiana tabacum]
MDMIMRMVLFGALALASLVQLTTAQTVHVVGDNIGWTIPNSGASVYTTWAAGKTFMVGDTLVFNFEKDQHDVLQVPKASFDGCSSQNAIGSAIMSVPANITLDSAGDHYYICTFGRHCQNGQKLAITVSSTGTPGANPPTSFAAGPSGSVPGGIAPPPPSSSTTVFASFLLSLSSIALAIFL